MTHPHENTQIYTGLDANSSASHSSNFVKINSFKPCCCREGSDTTRWAVCVTNSDGNTHTNVTATHRVIWVSGSDSLSFAKTDLFGQNILAILGTSSHSAWKKEPSTCTAGVIVYHRPMSRGRSAPVSAKGKQNGGFLASLLLGSGSGCVNYSAVVVIGNVIFPRLNYDSTHK